MNKHLLIALISSGLFLSASTEVFAQRGATQNNKSNAVDTRGSRGSSTTNRQATPSQTTTSTQSKTSQAPVRNTSSNPVLHQKGKNTQTATNNKKLPPKKVAPSENYRKMEARGEYVSKHHATNKSQIIRHSGTDYYYKKGVFYKYHNNKYVVSRPPIGVHVHHLPTPRIVVVNKVHYYYYYGTYYTKWSDTDYQVVQAPVGAVVESIPDGYEKLIIDGETYYIVDGVQYKAVVYDGEIWYEVLKIID